MPIPDEKVEEVRAAADLVDVAGDYVQLKRSGSRFMGLCPFHNEDTPSFSVDPEKNLYYCFGCGNGGDVFKFVQEIEGVEFVESIRVLADRYGIPLPEEEADAEAANEREAILHALRFAARFFYHQLTQTDRGGPALDYLRDRGYSASTIKQFGLGYAPDTWDALLTAAEDEQIDPETLEKAGLVVERNDGSGYYDRYRGRIIFPIFSHIGKVLAFAGRILDEDKDQPKYINSPETEVYHKKEVLYGLHQSKKQIRNRDTVAVVEGYTDVISLYQEGNGNVVATCGTSMTEEHVEKIKRYCDQVQFIYDSDEAGKRASRRGAQIAFQEGLEAWITLLPEGKDPDDFVKENGPDGLKKYVEENAKEILEFEIDRAEEQGRLDNPRKKREAIEGILESISNIGDSILRNEYIKDAAEKMGVYEVDLHERMESMLSEKKKREKRRKKRRKQSSQKSEDLRRNRAEETVKAPHVPPEQSHSPPSEASNSSNASFESPSGALPEERVLLRLMLEQGTRMVEFVLGHMALDEFSEGPPRELVETLVEMYREDDVRPQAILDGAHGDTLQSLAASVMMEEHEASENWAQREDIPVPQLNDRPYAAAESAMKLLKLDRVNEAIEQVRERAYAATRSEDDEQMQELQQKMMSLQELRKHIKRGAFLED